MAANPEEEKQDIPAFRISDKRVDDSWKEEVKREREQAAAAKAAQKTPPAAEAAAAGALPKEATQEGADQKSPAAPAAKSESAEPPTVLQQQSQIFMSLLAQLAQQALIQLGEIESPYSGQREMDLRGGRYSIELLATIQAKTKGNLNAEEEASLHETLHDLKLRFVELTNELQRQAQKKAMGGARPGPGGVIPG